jgi:hypothetical protein
MMLSNFKARLAFELHFSLDAAPESIKTPGLTAVLMKKTMRVSDEIISATNSSV